MRGEEQREKEKQDTSKKKVIEHIERIKDFEMELSSSSTNAIDTDSDFEPSLRKKNISKDRVCMELSMNDVFDKWVPFLTRYSVRAETSLLPSLFKIGGVDLNTVPVLKSGLHRNKKIVIGLLNWTKFEV